MYRTVIVTPRLFQSLGSAGEAPPRTLARRSRGGLPSRRSRSGARTRLTLPASFPRPNPAPGCRAEGPRPLASDAPRATAVAAPGRGRSTRSDPRTRLRPPGTVDARTTRHPRSRPAFWGSSRSNARRPGDCGYPNRPRPAGGFTGLPRHDVRRRRVRGIHVRRGDTLDDHRVAAEITDHAAHELGGRGAVLEQEVAPSLIRQ